MTTNSSTDEQDIICRFIKSLVNPGNTNYLSFLKPYMAVNEEIFRFMDEPSAHDSAWQFSTFANNIPSEAGDWHVSGNLLWHLYARWLVNFIPAPDKLTPAEEMLLNEARVYCEEQYDTYEKYRAPYDLAKTELSYLQNMPPGDRPPDYPQLLQKAQSQLNSAERDFEIGGHRIKFDEQYEIMLSLGRRDMSYSKYELFKNFGEPSPSNFGDYYPTNYLPRGFYDNDAFWKKFTVYEESNESSAGKTALPLYTIDEFNKKKTIAQIPDLTVTFDFISLIITRDWILPDALDTRSWKWASSTAANPAGNLLLSDGYFPPKGHLIMYPTQMILVRNIQLEARNAQTKKHFHQLLAVVDAGSTLHLGPLVLGRKQENRLMAEGEWIITENGIKSNQTNIAAYLCRLLPKSPNPDWKLWPSRKEMAKKNIHKPQKLNS